MTGGHHRSVPSNILAFNRSNSARSRMKKRKNTNDPRHWKGEPKSRSLFPNQIMNFAYSYKIHGLIL